MLRSTYAYIHTDAILHNVEVARSKLRPETKLMAIIKANAYGHGIVQVGMLLDADPNVDAFGIALPEEGALLRANGVKKPILILGAIDKEHIEQVLENELMPAVFTLDLLYALEREAAKRGLTANIHIKIDSGMHRIGVSSPEALSELLDALAACPHVHLDGVFTHFAKSESDPAFTDVQSRRFNHAVSMIHERGYDPIVHAANSGAIFLHPHLQYDMVRLGIALYGCHPDPELTPASELLPCLSWHSRVTNVQTIHVGEGVSYGLRFIAERETRVATIPLGYGDGYKRCLTDKAFVLLHGRRAPQIGTICMDQFMVDVSDIPDAAIGDPVVLLGEQAGERITADEMASWAGTISYEILLSISDRVPRIYR